MNKNILDQRGGGKTDFFGACLSPAVEDRLKFDLVEYGKLEKESDDVRQELEQRFGRSVYDENTIQGFMSEESARKQVASCERHLREYPMPGQVHLIERPAGKYFRWVVVIPPLREQTEAEKEYHRGREKPKK